jgi:hypothetical protein
MALPTSPLALSPANLAALQQRPQPAPPPAPVQAASAEGDTGRAPSEPPPGRTGRGRLVDILA